MNLLDALCFASFVAMLGSLLVFHHHKIPVVLLGLESFFVIFFLLFLFCPLCFVVFRF
jgi:hypothetical protein